MTAPDLEAQSLEDVFLVEHLDEAWAVPCESGRRYTSGCGSQNPADWILRFVGCCARAPLGFMLCDPCKTKMLADPAMWCNHCSTVFQPPETAFRLIEPLNRRTT
jgi:hypothetical protein